MNKSLYERFVSVDLLTRLEELGGTVKASQVKKLTDGMYYITI
jgi:hypothetical protein